MKKYISLFLFLMLAGSDAFSQGGSISSAFYMKFGAVMPVGDFTGKQTVKSGEVTPPKVTFYPARTGFVTDMGYLIYLGPGFANGRLRAGIDAGFLNFWFNPAKLDSVPSGDSKGKYYYYFAGQKFGPVLTVNPIDKLMIDISYKINMVVGYQDNAVSDYGINFWQNEMMLNIRYRLLVFSIAYNWGKQHYDDFNSDKTQLTIKDNTVRIMFGLGF